LEGTGNVYNSNGELLQTVYTGEDGVFRRKKIFTYDKSGFKTGEVSFDKDGDFEEKRVFTEDTVNDLSVKYYYNSYGELKTYDSSWFNVKKQPIKNNEARHDAYYFVTFDYDDEGRKISRHEKSQRFEDSVPAFFHTTYYPETGEQKIFIIQKGDKKTEFVYDSTGRKVSRITSEKNTAITEEYWNSEKNGDNNIIKKEKGKITEEIRNLVTLDEYGNTLRVIGIENGVIKSGIEFEYEYYE
jgi:hypothetical protein